MTALRKRAKALENQFAHQQELMFKAHARRNAMMGRWAANVIGLNDADTYARDLATYQVNEPRRLLEKLQRDLAAAGVLVDDQEITTRLDELLHKATEELLA
ncbi:DUF1476 domain-containing protein [Agrobacterium sp. ES01]|uniref:DUF1476 domain-containing protein n=1 Tax=Agrobacterium sp. ES01 TaxID=3420714 RepID=UPI003D0DD06B